MIYDCPHISRISRYGGFIINNQYIGGGTFNNLYLAGYLLFLFYFYSFLFSRVIIPASLRDSDHHFKILALVTSMQRPITEINTLSVYLEYPGLCKMQIST